MVSIVGRFSLVVASALAIFGQPCAAFAVDVADEVLQAERKRVAVLERIIPSVVSVFSLAGDNGGSGVLISSDGEALTNFHVVAGLGPFVKCGLSDGTINWAVVIGADPTGDLALIRLLGQRGEFRDDFRPATFGDSDLLQPGDTAIVIGNPFLLGTNLQPTVTHGVVSGVGRYQYPSGTFLEYTECIQTDASINPGNSGGPMFNGEGELIGINGRASFEKRGRVFTGAGYAISINQAKLFLDHLRSGRIIDHGTLGATVKTDRGSGSVYVQQVDPESDAARVGLQADDELVRFGTKPITSANDFKNRLGIYPANWIVPMSFRRDGLLRRVSVRLQNLHSRSELVEQFKTQPFTPPRPDDDETPKAATTANDSIPESYLKLYESEVGYVNRAANRVQLSRLLSTFEAWQPIDAERRVYLAGETINGRAVQITVGDAAAAIKVDEGLLGRWDPADGPEDQPPGTGGLLVAFEHLRQFLAAPENYFTDFEYVGSEPFDESGTLVDVIFSRRGETTNRWFFDRLSGRFIGFETQIRPEIGPCRILFADTKNFAGLTFPKSLTVESSGSEILQFEVLEAKQPSE